MPFDPRLAARMRAALAGRPGVTERKMFGSPCWFLNGNLLCAAEVGRYMFRVGPDLETVAAKRIQATPMDITGRRMRGIVWVDAGTAARHGIDTCIDLAVQFVGRLPAK